MQNEVPLQDLDARSSSKQVLEESAQVEPTDDERILEQALGRADGGLKAWTVLSTAFAFEAILWGMLDRTLRMLRY